jgi:hypothetical protein
VRSGARTDSTQLHSLDFTVRYDYHSLRTYRRTLYTFLLSTHVRSPHTPVRGQATAVSGSARSVRNSYARRVTVGAPRPRYRQASERRPGGGATRTGGRRHAEAVRAPNWPAAACGAPVVAGASPPEKRVAARAAQADIPIAAATRQTRLHAACLSASLGLAPAGGA